MPLSWGKKETLSFVFLNLHLTGLLIVFIIVPLIVFYGGCIMGSIAANDLKTRGVASISEKLSEAPEAIISVRGKDRYVVMDIEHYRYLRECELEAALLEAREDVAAGRVVTESVAEHIKRLTDGL